MSEPTLRATLLDDLRYDHWANGVWLKALLSHGMPDEIEVFLHILRASTLWLVRFDGISLTEPPVVEPIQAQLDDLYARWKAVVEREDLTRIIEFKNLRGEAMARRSLDIMRHVVNHGTYHRGQLRGMLGSRSADQPETDYILYTYDRDAGHG